MMRIQCQKRDENNGMAEQSEKVADIDPRFSSLLCVHANGNKMRILKLDVFIYFFFFVVLEYMLSNQ